MKYIKLFEEYKSDQIEIFSNDKTSIHISNDELGMLYDMGYIYEESPGEYSFHDNNYPIIQQILGSMPSTTEIVDE